MTSRKKNAVNPPSPRARPRSRASSPRKVRPSPRPSAPRQRRPRPVAKARAKPKADASQWSNLLSNTGIAVILLDAQLRLRRFTPAATDLLAVSDRDTGRPLKTLARKFSDSSLLADARAVLKNRPAVDAEVVSESGRAYLRRALPYRGTSREIEGVVLTFTDITRLKLAETALRSSEERHRLILEGVAEYAILILDHDGRFVTWSRSAERILGFTQGEALGQPLDLIYTDEDRAAKTMQRELQEAREYRSLTDERWHVRKDGTRFWGTGVFSALNDETNRLYGFVKVLRDNTDRKLVEETLHKAKTDAEAANSAKDHFLANISHELRTPLSATLLWAKLLSTQQPVSPQQLKEGLEAIEKSAKEQQALIEDLVDTSRMVAGKLRLQAKDVPLVALAESALAVIRPAATEKGVTIEDRLDPHTGSVRADPMRLKQVLNNLLTNAVKFTPAGGRVTLTVERQGDQVILRVADTGQGIGPEFLGRVFDRFTQADSSGFRNAGGLGLGLSIARQLVEMHGGKIAVHSDGLAKGTTFTVHLPLPAIPPSAAPAPAPRKISTLQDLTILVVEDVDETRRALVAVLTGAGARVIPAVSAQQALEEFNRLKPDLILSDIGLGKISGHELIQQIRQWERAQKAVPVPALALTAYADERNRSMALASGFQQILIKPIDPLLLVSSLAALNAGRENS